MKKIMKIKKEINFGFTVKNESTAKAIIIAAEITKALITAASIMFIIDNIKESIVFIFMVIVNLLVVERNEIHH